MLRSLYSGVSGMKSNQVKMDVIGNNIANVNTTAFKSGRVKFQETLSNTMSTALGPDFSGKGAKNPKQVGLGTTISSIDTMMADGVHQPTGRELDFALEGEGFLVVSDETTDNNAPNRVSFTRDGCFYRDSDGRLVNASGDKVIGYPAEDDIDIGDGSPAATVATQKIKDAIPENLRSLEIPTTLVVDDSTGQLVKDATTGRYKSEAGAGETVITLDTFNVDAAGTITAIGSDQNSYKIGRLAIAKFKNREGLTKEGSNSYGKTANSGEPEYGIAAQDSFGSITQGALEVSNVDLANEFTEMIITSRAYQANSRSITTSDEMLQELLNLKR